MRNIKTLLLITTLLFISSCKSTMGELVKNLEDAAKRVHEKNNPQKKINYTQLTKTELKNIFSDKPYVKGKPETSWPRVAVTVLKSPASHKTPSAYMRNSNITACYDLEALLWGNAKTSKKYQFGWCFRNDVVYEIPFYQVLGNSTRSINILFDPYLEKINTGKKRTTGPNMPRTVLPNDIRHQAFIDMSGHNINEAMIGSIMYQMGFDWLEKQDRRLWFVKFNGIDGVSH